MQRGVLAYIQGYDPGIFPQDAAQRWGIEPGRVVNLASNENPYPPPDNVLEAAGAKLASSTNRYPDPKYRLLKDGLARYCGRSPSGIAVGNGASEILDMVCKVFLEPFDRIVMTAPSYTMYALLGMLREATIEFVGTAGHGFALDGEFLLERAANSKIIFLCSPNNPTGSTVDRKELELILKGTEGIVVVDEAYAEFSGSSAAEIVDRYPNLIIARSMSKYFSLAGLRLGYALADEDIVSSLEKTRLPFSISSIAEAAAVEALDSLDYYDRIRGEILKQRKGLFRGISGLEGLEPYPSSANFLMVKVNPPIRGLVDSLASTGHIVRDLQGLPGLEGQFIRITVGTQDENESMLRALESAIP